MKKYLTSLALAALVCGCQSHTETCTIKGSELPAELEGAMVYLVIDPIGTDSARISNNSFTLSSSTPSDTLLGMISIPQGDIELPFIPESGAFTLTRTPSGAITITSEDPGSLNATLTSFTKEVEEQTDALASKQESLEQQLREASDPKESREIQAQIDQVRVERAGVRSAIAARYYESHHDDLVGALMFRELDYADEAEYVSLYEGASELVQRDAKNRERYSKAKSALETSVGKPYKGDFEIPDGEGKSVKLSDYMDGKRYLLLDFWASWCVYCRQAMPELKRLSEEHSKTLRVLSIGVREKSKADNDRAKESLGLSWETIFDKDNVSYDAYGVLGIPTLILISPEGEIVFRGYQPAKLQEKIIELSL